MQLRIKNFMIVNVNFISDCRGRFYACPFILGNRKGCPYNTHLTPRILEPYELLEK